VGVTGERRLVTVLFCDLVGSTRLGEQLDPEALQSVQRAYFEQMRAVVERFAGTVEKFAGDAVLAVFGVPQLHEDDAERAVRCAFEMRTALVALAGILRPRFGVELEARIGVETGEAMVGAADALATGDVMNVAARLEQHAAPGEILVGHETVRLTSEVVEYGDEIEIEAKGKRQPLRAAVARRLIPRRPRVRPTLVGRNRELERLEAVLQHAIAERTPQTVVVLGEPGIGKTRLAEEFAERAAPRAGVFRGACLPFGEGSIWLPFADILRAEAEIGETDEDSEALAKLRASLATRHPPEEVRLIAAQLGPLVTTAGSGAGSEQELVWGLRRYFEELAATRAAIVVLDDLHLADAAILEAIQDLLQTIASAQLVIVLQGRPELRERVSELLAAEDAVVISLGALTAKEAGALVDDLGRIVGTSWASDVRDWIVERGGGSPLFLEEVAAIAGEEGVDATVPRSLQALIGARLDLFPPDVKRAAQAAAVVGDVFWDGAIAAIADVDAPAQALRRLRTGGFVDEQTDSAFLGQRQFRFHHALIRQVAYESLPKIERAELHRRTGTWLERFVVRRPDLIVPIAHHLERALSLPAEVAPLVEASPELKHAAVDALRGAATWTGAYAGTSQSIELLRRALTSAQGDRALEQVASAQLAAMLARSGAGGEAVELADAVLGAEPTAEGAALAWLALAEAARARTDAQATLEAGERALEMARSLRLTRVQIEAHDLIGIADAWSGRLLAAVEHRRLATELALELGDVALAAWNVGGYAVVCLLEMGRLGPAEAQAGEAMRLALETGSLRALESAHSVFGLLRRAQDRLDDAVAHGTERHALAERLGESLWQFNALTFSLAEPLIDAGRLEEAWQCLEQALDVAQRGSVPADPARALRIQILLRWGRLDEAEAEAGALAAPELYREVAALRAARGRPDEAEDIWRRALDAYAESEDRLDRAETTIGYARFLAGSRRRDEAVATLDAARVLVAGTGAHLHERLIREAEALIK
jgi:class 3 adenylate cyclase/tetratricopeptide (TPR) repeat protein